VSGACACGGGKLLCGGACVDGQSDPGHCGSCGVACAAGQTCRAGVCTAPACKGGELLCAGICILTKDDAANCGGCGVLCLGGPCKDGKCKGQD
jgi:hypothetical protein